MPELPEVETVRSAMARHLTGRTINSIDVSGKPLREPVPEDRLLELPGRRFSEARRRAKYLILSLDDGSSVLIHLGMSGNLLFRDEYQLHDHVIFHLDHGPALVFNDPRRFGLLLVLETGEEAICPYLCDLGAEPLGPEFNGDYLHSFCRNRSRPIKNLIMDSRIVAGIGNIYASEALFRAGIRPTTQGRRLSRRRSASLAEEIKQVLAEAIEAGGTTVNDYKGSGEGGRFQQELAVYGRADENCFVCDSPIRNRVLAGRSSFYCSNCQK
jgi:formamidopyrimidine-DNA glycosylase